MKTSGVILFLGMCMVVTGSAQTVLKDAFKNDFLIGAALNDSIFSGRNPVGAALVIRQFDTISPENALKWASVHPRPGVFDFGAADRYVKFGVENKMFIIGHNLIWHEQTPPWVFRDDQGNLVDRDTLLARMREHIFTMVGRYQGKIGGWDVVNEALNEDGTLRETLWEKIIGDDYIAKAFEFAHEADPQAQLYYNDYSLENPLKRNGAIALIKKLQSQGVHLDGIGLQGHYQLDSPTVDQIGETISAISKLGLKVMITELDVDVLPPVAPAGKAEVSLDVAPRPDLNPYADGLPDSVQQHLARRYAGLFSVFMQHRDAVARVTFWGVTDADSWLNRWPVKGRTSYPLLFDREGKPKAAFDAVLKTAQAVPVNHLLPDKPTSTYYSN